MKDGLHTYKPKGICCRTITFKSENNIISDIHFEGGCNGNLKMIAKLLEGMTNKEIADKCGGNTCGTKQTSCADQLAKAMLSEE